MEPVWFIAEKLAHGENIDTEEVTPDMIATDIRMARLETAPRGGPLRAELVDAFASEEGMMPQVFGAISDATRAAAGP